MNVFYQNTKTRSLKKSKQYFLKNQKATEISR